MKTNFDQTIFICLKEEQHDKILTFFNKVNAAWPAQVQKWCDMVMLIRDSWGKTADYV